MYVYYKIGTRSFRLRPPTFLRCKGTSKIRIDEKKRDIFSLSPLLCVCFLGKRKQHALKGQKLLAQGNTLGNYGRKPDAL